MIDEALLGRVRDNLTTRANATMGVQMSPVLQGAFSFEKIRHGFARGEILKWARDGLGEDNACPAIYRLSVESQQIADAILEKFEGADHEGKMPRNNGVTDSMCVYVGSSLSIGSRLREHLSRASDSTYALRLGNWCPDADGSINVEVIGVRGDVSTSHLQDLEDELWRTSRPMFGKLGPK